MADETVPDEKEAAPAEAATGESASEAPAATEDAPASAVEEAPAVTAEAAESAVGNEITFVDSLKIDRDAIDAIVIDQIKVPASSVTSMTPRFSKMLETFRLVLDAKALAENGLRSKDDLKFVNDAVIYECALPPVVKAKLKAMIEKEAAAVADETVPDEEEAAPAEAASEAPAATEDAPASAVEEAPAVTAEAAEAPAAGKQGHAGCVPPYGRGSDMSVCTDSRAGGHGRGR